MFKRLKNYFNPPLPPEDVQTVSFIWITMKDGKVLSWKSGPGLPEGYEAGSYHPDGPWSEFYEWFDRAEDNYFYRFLSSRGASLNMFRRGDIVRIMERVRTEVVTANEEDTDL